MNLYQVTASMGGKYTVTSQVYGKSKEDACNNMIASLRNNFSGKLTVIKIKEVNRDEEIPAHGPRTVSA